MIRSFIAIDITSQATLKQILALQETLQNTDADLKFVTPENVHVTLRFLGEISPSLIGTIGGDLKTLRFKPFVASLLGVGIFPSVRRINVVWIGIKKGLLNFIDIYRQIESQLKRLDIHPDNRGFNPHVTVARVRSARNKDKLIKAVLTRTDKEFGPFPVNCIKLKKSVLTPKGPIYTTLMEVRASVLTSDASSKNLG